MSNVVSRPPRVNGILETSLYVESPDRSAEFYQRVFGFQPLEPGEALSDETRLWPNACG
jgi:catechol 2,3-dioxygenase-like lactoylglutathione lyase family enzyme